MPSPHFSRRAFFLPVKQQRGSEEAGIPLALFSKSLHELLTVAHDITAPQQLVTSFHNHNKFIIQQILYYTWCCSITSGGVIHMHNGALCKIPTF